jgi:hypothetical protein
VTSACATSFSALEESRQVNLAPQLGSFFNGKRVRLRLNCHPRDVFFGQAAPPHGASVAAPARPKHADAWCAVPRSCLIPIKFRWLPMSALVQKQTSGPEISMSALPPKADIVDRNPHVRFVPKADIGPLFWHRQFRLIAAQRPISATD